MCDKKYDIVVAMVTVLRTRIKYVHHMEERFFLKLCIFLCNHFKHCAKHNL